MATKASLVFDGGVARLLLGGRLVAEWRRDGNRYVFSRGDPSLLHSVLRCLRPPGLLSILEALASQRNTSLELLEDCPGGEK